MIRAGSGGLGAPWTRERHISVTAEKVPCNLFRKTLHRCYGPAQPEPMELDRGEPIRVDGHFPQQGVQVCDAAYPPWLWPRPSFSGSPLAVVAVAAATRATAGAAR